MRVELAPELGPKNHIDATYGFMVYTTDYINDNFLSKQLPVIGRAIMIIPILDHNWTLDFFKRHNKPSLEELPGNGWELDGSRRL